jgi:hypothetical protein
MRLARWQAIYYLVTGSVPLVSMRGFEAITGPKTDRWLVRTVALLLIVIGSALALASRRHPTPEMILLGAGSAGSLAAIDIVYVAKRRIWPVFLLDAVVEIGLVAGWMRVWRQSLEYEHRRTDESVA